MLDDFITEGPLQPVPFYVRDRSRSLGLGDIAAFITRWTGIAWAVRISGKSCGCNARRNRWNRYRLRLPFYKV